jgi:CRISPR-associated protein Cas5t
MKALRIVLTQDKAHYRKEESLENKMTYPLPPFSTVIGALHNACGFKEYKDMYLSIQGNYKSLSRQPYTDYCFLDSIMDDRGILVKMRNSELYSSSFDKVASAMKKQGNSFINNITIDIHNKKLMEEYRCLKKVGSDISIFKATRIKKLNELFKKRNTKLSLKKKSLDKESLEYSKIFKREKEIKFNEKVISEKLKKYEYEKYFKQISKFKSLTTALRHYEILHQAKVIIHVNADEMVLNAIKENIYNLKSIGRSEDFVDVIECKFVELTNEIKNEVKSEYSAYLNYDLIKSEQILLNEKNLGIPASGTKYWINKVYNRDKGWREFEKVEVVFASNYLIDEESEGVFFDEDGKYIVNFN